MKRNHLANSPFTIFCDQENKSASNEIGIEDKIDDKIEEYIHKHDI